ncbi:MAG: YdjY domain-containing protein [Planctomycetota bacterium]
MSNFGSVVAAFALLFLAILGTQSVAQPQQPEAAEATAPVEAEPPKLPAPNGAKAMPAPHRVWIDPREKQVFVDGYVSLDEGLLEMFACTMGTKEHESVIAVYSSAKMVHTALLAVGAIPGHPVRWDPTYQPPAGMEIDIEIRWLDDRGKWKSTAAQQWLRDVDTKQVLQHPWVFAGSGFWTDEETGKQYYLAEEGSLICVSNFSSATLDIPVESSQANEGLLFEANKDTVPAIGTPVRLVLTPKPKKNAPPYRAE